MAEEKNDSLLTEVKSPYLLGYDKDVKLLTDLKFPKRYLWLNLMLYLDNRKLILEVCRKFFGFFFFTKKFRMLDGNDHFLSCI